MGWNSSRSKKGNSQGRSCPQYWYAARIIGKNHIIGKTGTTGLALGDHLHFGVLVQGIEVRPEEWMDKKWMKDNIYDVLESAKKAINN